MAERTPQIQLVGPPSPSAQRSRRLGLGLLLSLVIGWPALTSAVADAEAFEASVARFLLGVALSVTSVLLLGGLYDRFTADADDDDPAPVPTPPHERGTP